MFVDRAAITVKGGRGGDGHVSFHREKYVSDGGPSGGDGGRGGSVILQVDTNMNTLMDFKYKKKYIAENGGNGSKKCAKGKDGCDTIVKVPQGTMVIMADTGDVIADLSEKDSRFTVAKGGRGGFGNARFKNSVRQAPSFAKPGLNGAERNIILELKSIADIGLIGFPNAGKSSLLAAVSQSSPKIGNYHFTTLYPNLGIAQTKCGEVTLADIPGLIEGASRGAGLGFDFLKHIERTRVLINVVDISCEENRNPMDDYLKINKELADFSSILAEKPQIVAANKVDSADEKMCGDFAQAMSKLGAEVYFISAVTGSGVKKLVDAAAVLAKNTPAYSPIIKEIQDFDENDSKFDVIYYDNVYEVTGGFAEQLISSCNFDDTLSAAHFQNMLRKHGIIDRLEDMGINEGDTVRILDTEFQFFK